MASSRTAKLVPVVLIALVIASVAPIPSFAQDCAPDALCLPAGLACPGFGLQVQQSGGEHYVTREFFNKNGDVVRFLQAGKGYELTFTNLATGQTLTTPANGSDGHWTYNPDGSTTLVTTGHYGLIFYPTDVPAGPSTKIYIGRTVIAIDANGNWTMVEASGQSIDICAALTG